MPAEGPRRKESTAVRVGEELGVTLQVTDEPRQFIRCSFWHERESPTSSPADLEATAAAVHEYTSKVLQERIDELTAMVQGANTKPPRSKRTRSKTKRADRST